MSRIFPCSVRSPVHPIPRRDRNRSLQPVRCGPCRLEYLSCRLMAADMGRTALAEAIDFYHAAGWDEQAIERYKEKFGSFREMIYPMPAAFRRLTDGETFL